jgi:hypothetical protein
MRSEAAIASYEMAWGMTEWIAAIILSWSELDAPVVSALLRTPWSSLKYM